MNKLIVNADDFGLTESVTRAIVDCHRAGSVSSTTMMVQMPGTEYAAKVASSVPDLGIGLHFTLTLGRPISPPHEVRSLVQDDGTFPVRKVQERNVLLRRVRPQEIELELRAQLRRLRDLGIHPTHIDSHQHIHVLPAVFDVVASLGTQEGLPVRMPWRWRGRTRQPIGKRLKGQALRLMTLRNASRWRRQVKMNTGHCSVFDNTLPGGTIDLETYAELLQPATSVLELMVHPGLDDAETAALVAIGDVSRQELAVLGGTSLFERARQLGYEREHFGTSF